MSHSKKYPCRCQKCDSRRSLNQQPDHYFLQPKCASCGHRGWRVDNYRIKNEMGGINTCGCSGMHYPHRKGSRFCFNHPMAEQDHTERYDQAVA